MVTTLSRRQLLVFLGAAGGAAVAAPYLRFDPAAAQFSEAAFSGFTPVRLPHPVEAYTGKPSFMPDGTFVPGGMGGTTLPPSADPLLAAYTIFDDVVVPPEFERYVIVRWGDRVFPALPGGPLDQHYVGYNADYTAFFPRGRERMTGFLWVNHEYVSFPLDHSVGEAPPDLAAFPTSFEPVIGRPLTAEERHGEFMYNIGGSVIRLKPDAAGRLRPTGSGNSRRIHGLSGLGINTERSDGYQGVTSWGPYAYQQGDQAYLVGTGPAATDVLKGGECRRARQPHHRHRLQLRRQLHPVGHGADRRGELPGEPGGVLRRGQRGRAPDRHPDRLRGRQHRPDLRVVGREVRVDRRDRPVPPRVASHEAHVARSLPPRERGPAGHLPQAAGRLSRRRSADVADTQPSGGLYKIIEETDDGSSLSFRWERFKQGGEDGAEHGAGFANVDNLAFDQDGHLWGVIDMSTGLHNGFGLGASATPIAIDHAAANPDQAANLVGVFGANWMFTVPLDGPDAGLLIPFAYGPPRCEMTGPTFAGDTLILSVQHPSEDVPINDGTPASTLSRQIELLDLSGGLFNQQRTLPRGSNWPSNLPVADGGAGDPLGPPRPSVIGIRRRT